MVTSEVVSAPGGGVDGLTDRRNIGVALAVPAPWGAELQRWRDSLGDKQAGSIPTHVTLLPPTAVPTASMPGIEMHLDLVAALGAPFSIRLRGTDTFRPVSPVVFVALTEGAPECARLQAAVRRGPLERDLVFDYHPHVTVAHDLPDARLDEAAQALRQYRAAFRVTGFDLYEHGGDGVWRPVRHFAFPPGDV